MSYESSQKPHFNAVMASRKRTDFISESRNKRIATGEIKEGLERIKKAQEQVLEELRRNQINSENHPEPDRGQELRKGRTVGNPSQLYQVKSQENESLKRQIAAEKRKSSEKSQLYRRRVVDLETSLLAHQQSQNTFKDKHSSLEQQFQRLKSEYQDLDRDHQRLIKQSQNFHQNMHAQQKKALEYARLESDYAEMRSRYERIAASTDKLSTEKTQLLKELKNLQSENIALKKQQNSIHQTEPILELGTNYALGEVFKNVNKIALQISKANKNHEQLYTKMSSQMKLGHGDLLRQESYQNSLNKTLEYLEKLQSLCTRDQDFASDLGGDEGLLEFSPQSKIDPKQSADFDIQRLEQQIHRKFKNRITTLKTEKQELSQLVNQKDKQKYQLLTEIQELAEKIGELREEKQTYLKELSDMTLTLQDISTKNSEAEAKTKSQYDKQMKQKERQYNTMINELNEQMLVIKRQKKDLDQLIQRITDKKRGEEEKKNKFGDLRQINQQLKIQSEKIQSKYDMNVVEKQHFYLRIKTAEAKVDELTQALAHSLENNTELNNKIKTLNSHNSHNLSQIDELKQSIEQLNKTIDQKNNTIKHNKQQRLIQIAQLRSEIEQAMSERQQLREMKMRLEKLMQDNKYLGKIAWQNTVTISHLWEIKEIQYMNLNQVLKSLKPSLEVEKSLSHHPENGQ